jgi:catechol 2,3-dioxygenase-like lactoylglutathione lyase family enzyme
MLGDKNTSATVAVSDLKAAARFYEETLGLKRVHAEGAEAVTYQSGATTLLVYRSTYAGGNKATAVTWQVGSDIDQLVRDLGAKGVRFEKYDMPNTKHDGDVHVMGDMRVAWFKDPDANIHALINQ